MKRQMEEELRKKEEELANLSKTYEERMKEAAVANQVPYIQNFCEGFIFPNRV